MCLMPSGVFPRSAFQSYEMLHPSEPPHAFQIFRIRTRPDPALRFAGKSSICAVGVAPDSANAQSRGIVPSIALLGTESGRQTVGCHSTEMHGKQATAQLAKVSATERTLRALTHSRRSSMASTRTGPVPVFAPEPARCNPFVLTPCTGCLAHRICCRRRKHAGNVPHICLSERRSAQIRPVYPVVCRHSSHASGNCMPV